MSAPAVDIAYWLLKDALDKVYSMPLKVVTVKPDGSPLTRTEIEAIEKRYWLTFNAPINQAQTLDALLTQLQELGFLTGIDYYPVYGHDAAGAPTYTIALAYPRAGIAEPDEAPVIELSQALEFEYTEDGTTQSNLVVTRAGAAEGKGEKEEERNQFWAPAVEEGYPRLEKVATMPALAKSATPLVALEAFLWGELAVSTYPQLVPIVTLPMFGVPSIYELSIGDDVLLRIPRGVGDLPSDNPRFPNGLPETSTPVYFRIIRIDCEVPDEGVPVMKITLNLPPKSEDDHQIPVAPPGAGAS